MYKKRVIIKKAERKQGMEIMTEPKNFIKYIKSFEFLIIMNKQKLFVYDYDEDKYPKKYLKGFELRVKQEIPQDIDGLTGIVIHNMDIDDRKTGKEFISLMQVAQKKKLPTLIWSQDEEYFGKVQKRLKREGLNCQNMYFHSTRLCQTYWERMIEIFR